MGLLGWIFGRESISRNDGATRPDAGHRERFLDLPSHRFVGQFSLSPNRRYKIAWSEGRGADKERPLAGRYLLLDGETVVAEGKMTRPTDGAVADNGTFILADARQPADLSATLYAFTVGGKRIVARDFKANLFSCGISDDGRFAACQTCNSHNESDSGKLALFDLAARRELAIWQAESGWPDGYRFSPDGNTVGLVSRQLGTFRYSLTGEFTDRAIWQDACLTKGDYATAIIMAERLIESAGGNISPELSLRIVTCIDRITPQLATADPQWHALALKAQGACLEAQGKSHDALACYDKALTLNPKVGVKRRAEKIRKTSSRLAD